MSSAGLMLALMTPSSLSEPKSFACPTSLLYSISQPSSGWHADEQQSPLTASPSSHCSARTMMPSPQVEAQVLGIPGAFEQVQPASILQPALQPSRLLVLPSSHFSSPTTTPSPQSVMHWLGMPMQNQPAS